MFYQVIYSFYSRRKTNLMAEIHRRSIHKITCCPQAVARVASRSTGQPEVSPATSQPSLQPCMEQQNCLVWTEVHGKATEPVPWAG